MFLSFSLKLSAVALFAATCILLDCQSRVLADCNPTEVWWTFPESKDLVGVSEQLKSDSGPSTSTQDQTVTFSRRWQGATSLRSLSITLIIHPSTALAASSVKRYGEGLLKNNDGQQVSLGDLGYRTNDDRRPYFMAHKGRFVITCYTSYPGRNGQLINIGDQEKMIRDMFAKITGIACYAEGNPPPPPINNGPSIYLSFSPSQPLPTDTITILAKGSDPDGDPLTYTWELTDFNSKRIPVNWSGSSALWKNPKQGSYKLTVIVTDGRGGMNFDTVTIRVLPDPARVNQSPLIKLSVQPNPATVGQSMTFTASVSDPDGDKVGGQEWRPGTNRFFEVPQKVNVTRNGNTFSKTVTKLIAGRSTMSFHIEDDRGGKAEKTVDFVIINPKQSLDVKLTCNCPYGADWCKTQAGGQVSFTAVVSNPQQDPLTYAWSIDGKARRDWQGNQALWNNVPFTQGYYTIKVQVWKKSGETASNTIKLLSEQIQLPPPVVNNTPKVNLICLTNAPQTGQPVCLQAVASDADPQDTLSWKWNLDGRPMSWSGLQPVWKQAAAGKHSVMITVSDGTDTVSDTISFTVVDPPVSPPPPLTKSIIHSSDFIDTVGGSVWDNIIKDKWKVGEEISLRIQCKPVNRSHKLEIVWYDPSGKTQLHDKAVVSAGAGFGNGKTLWSYLRSRSNDITGRWRVDLLVDGRFDRSLTFDLSPKARTRYRSTPARNQYPPTSTSPTKQTPEDKPLPASGWQDVF
jgi:hypothetical protein